MHFSNLQKYSLLPIIPLLRHDQMSAHLKLTRPHSIEYYACNLQNSYYICKTWFFVLFFVVVFFIYILELSSILSK